MGSLSVTFVLVISALVAVLLLVIFVVLLFVLRRGPALPEPKPIDLKIDVASLNPSGPSIEVPLLTYSGKPVRLAALVVAPVGRSGAIPEADRLLDAVDQLIPGLVEVISTDDPMVKFWPGQLSTHGFAHVFFRNVKLPGARGVGTPWCSVAGKFKAGGQQYLAGMLCNAGGLTELSEIAVDDNEQWARILEVRRA
ncbi:MAG: hypothetical protein H8E66_07905 [Planctomycetes bacterium]|nr:hypothetical protein [Planctomycetota bacterium]